MAVDRGADRTEVRREFSADIYLARRSGGTGGE